MVDSDGDAKRGWGRLPTIEIIDFHKLLGSNIYSPHPAIKVSINARGIPRRLCDTSSATRSLFLELLPESASDAILTDLIARAILLADFELCRAMNFYLTSLFSPLVNIVSQDTLVLVWESDDAQMSHAAASAVVEAVDRALRGEAAAVEYARAREENLERAKKRRLSNSTAVLVAAAKRKRIPFEFIARNHIVLGQGKYQKQLFSTITGSTSFAAAKMALDKRRGNRLLAHAGLPVPRQIVVRTRSEAVDAATQFGGMVVLKPMQGNQSRGVSVKLRGRKAVEAAFDVAAAEETGGVLVEEFVSGPEYRVTVVGGRVVAAVMCRPPEVVGDGSRSMRDLIDALNREPDRDGSRLSRVEIDDDLLRHLASQRLALDSVPRTKQLVSLRSIGHLARGGVPFDVTDIVHPKNRELCERIVQVAGLEVAGIDLITPDISRDHNEVGCTILEVNARPGIEFHLWARGGMPRDVAEFILADMYNAAHAAELPTVVVMGDRHTGMVAKAIDQRFQSEGRRVALLAKTGAFVNGEPQTFRKGMNPQQLARDPFLEALVYAVSPDRLWSHGLGLSGCHAVSVTPSDGDKSEILGDVAEGILRKASRGYFLIDEDDVQTRRALASVPYTRLVLVSTQTGIGADLQRHLRNGGLALFMRWSADGTGAHMVLASVLGDLAVEPALLPSGSRPPKVRAAMHAMAISYFAREHRWFE